MVRTINRSAAFYHKSKQGPSLLCIQANEVRLIKKSPECYRLTRESERDVCKPKKVHRGEQPVQAASSWQ